MFNFSRIRFLSCGLQHLTFDAIKLIFLSGSRNQRRHSSWRGGFRQVRLPLQLFQTARREMRAQIEASSLPFNLNLDCRHFPLAAFVNTSACFVFMFAFCAGDWWRILPSNLKRRPVSTSRETSRQTTNHQPQITNLKPQPTTHNPQTAHCHTHQPTTHHYSGRGKAASRE